MALPSIAPEMCGFAYRRTYVVNIVDLPLFSDTSYKCGSACCHQCRITLEGCIMNGKCCMTNKFVITSINTSSQSTTTSSCRSGKSGKNTCEGKYNCEGICDGEYWIGGASGQYANFYCPQAKPGAMPQAIF
ncbi:conserved hypothetical protein [Trichinella spiralis]|uniref:hypothetical protein n=1 Tax=Trichinella spiralis TaxID=6334 RepID=UPI0001EFBDA5|nr:conserved hypothetical protein [Trichinella spiralis]